MFFVLELPERWCSLQCCTDFAQEQLKTTTRKPPYLIAIHDGRIQKGQVLNWACGGRGCWRKGDPCTLLVGLQSSSAAVENNMENPQNLKSEWLYDLAILLWGMYQKMQTLTWKYKCTPMFMAASFAIAKTWKLIIFHNNYVCPSVDEWIKLWCRCKMEYSAIKVRKSYHLQ